MGRRKERKRTMGPAANQFRPKRHEVSIMAVHAKTWNSTSRAAAGRLSLVSKPVGPNNHALGRFQWTTSTLKVSEEMANDPAKSELPAASRPTASPQDAIGPATRRLPVDDTEVELWVGNYSGKEMIINWVIAAIATVATIVLVFIFGRWDPVVWMISMGCVAVIWVWLGFLLLYRKWSVAYRLTNQRFVHRRGLLAIRTDRIETIDIDDVAFTQGILERMLGVGTIRIASTDRSHPELILRGIDKVQEVASLMDGARRKERVRRGLHIEAT